MDADGVCPRMAQAPFWAAKRASDLSASVLFVQRARMAPRVAVFVVQGGGRFPMIFILGVLVAGMLLGLGLVVGVILAIWLYEKHRLRMDEANRRAYLEARAIEVKRINMENERRLRIRSRNSELPISPEEEQKSYEESLRRIGMTDEEVSEELKARRKM